MAVRATRRAEAQCHLVFRKAGARGQWWCQWWGGPLVRAGRPGPALSSKNQALGTIEEPARGPAADQGSAPPIMQVCARGKTKRHWASARLVGNGQCPVEDAKPARFFPARPICHCGQRYSCKWETYLLQDLPVDFQGRASVTTLCYGSIRNCTGFPDILKRNKKRWKI